MKTRVCVFGLWHLGCVTASCLADLGFEVKGLDFDENNVNNLKKGIPPLFEPGLAELIQKNLQNQRLSFYIEPKEALKDIDFLWVTFDTPVDERDVADLDFLNKNIISIIPHIPDNTKIILSSQAPVGFTKEIEEIFSNKFPSKKVLFSYSPENLQLGKALKVFKEPDRIVVGIRNSENIKEFKPIFSEITDRIEWMKTESAEMTKHAINSFLAMSVVFANELAVICESVGADAKEVSRGLKTEERIGPKAYLSPGLSFAGGTLARDINFLIQRGVQYKKNLILLPAIKSSNEYHKRWIKNKCLELFDNIKGVKFAILGLTYKPNTDTLRRSSSIELCEWIFSQSGIINAYDPNITILSNNLSNKIDLKNNISDVLLQADCVIVCTEHLVFKEIVIKNEALFSNKVLIDPTGFLEKEISEKRDLKYVRIGRA
jgi:UDPglucose 6-dehydrogenase